MENSYVNDLVRTQVGVLGGRPAQLYPMSWEVFVLSVGNGFTQGSGGQPRRLLVLRSGVSGCSSLQIPHRGTRIGVKSEQVHECWFSFQNKAAGNSL